MENNIEMQPQPKSILESFKSWKYRRSFIAILIGGSAGFIYYYFFGNNTGKDEISGNPYFSIIWGGLMGLFVVNSPCSRGRC
jgi:hypothetical protein